jgi:hypothetical protein
MSSRPTGSNGENRILLGLLPASPFIRVFQHRCYTHSLSQSYLPQSLRSSFGAPAGGVLTVLSMQGIALRYS